MEETTMKNPWLGLESYKEGEVLYGRDDDIRDLSQCVLNDTDTLLYGKSGIGKSSILNAGIIPAARRRGFLPVLVRFSHKEKQAYLCQIKDAIANSMIPIPLDESGNQIILSTEEEHQRETELGRRIVKVVDCKESNKESLYEFFHRHTFHDADGERIKLLIIFDQFEEIFTLQTDESSKKRLFAELADLLNDVMPTELQYAGIPTTESQKKKTIIGAGNFGNLFNDLKLGVEDNLPEYITDNEIHLVFTIREDFLSEFEYYSSAIPSLKQNRYGLRPINEEQAAQIIMRPMPGLIDESVAKLIIEKVTGRTDFKLDGIPEIEVDSAVLSLYLNRLYDAKTGSQITSVLVEDKGGEIIADFYNDAISGVSELTVEYLEDMLLNGQGRRDNITIFDAINDGGVTEKELDILCNKKKILRQFNYAGDLRIEYVHDILCPVVKAHKDERILLKQQEEERRRQEEEKLKIQVEAEKKQREIEEQAARERAEMEAESVRVKRRNRNRLIALSCVIAFIVFTIGSYYYLFEKPYSEIYGNFTTKNGWPIGLGDQLDSSSEKEKCTVFYKLTRNGRLSSFMGKTRPFTKVEILNWNGEPSTNIFFESPIVRFIDRELDDAKAAEFAKLLLRVSYWQYTPDANGLISMKTAFDINNQELYSENYSSTNNIEISSKHVLWCVFYDKKGNPLQVSDNGTDRIRYTISEGYITGCSFFTVLGTPQLNTSGAYGYSYEVDSVSANVVSQCQVDKFGDKVDSTMVHFTEFENGRNTKSDVCNVEYSKQNVIWKYKGHNDTIHISKEGTVDYVTATYGNAERMSIRYKSQDELLEKKLFSNDTLVYSEKYIYSSKLDSIQYFNTSIQPSLYTEKYSYPKKNVTERTFWCNGEKILLNIGLEGIACHKIVKETSIQNSDSTVTTSYFDSNNALTQEGVYSRSEIIFDKNSGNVLFEYYYDFHDEICKSEMFTYNEYGIRVSRAVAGIDRTPVRCPNWDWNGFSYYSMEFLKDFTDNMFVTIMGTNESGDRSYIMKEDSLFSITELPLMFTTTEDANPKIKSKTFSFSLSKNNYELLANKKSIPFLHILNKKSILYSAYGQRNKFWRDGLFDNDIPYKVGKWGIGFSPQVLLQELNSLEENGGDIQVLRYFNSEYRVLSFSVRPGFLYAEIHNIFLTDKEYNNIKKYLK